MDPLSLSLVQSVLAPLRLARDAIQGAREIKETLRDRYADYVSMLEPLNQSPGKVKDKGIEHELQRLKDLFNKVKDLVHNHIANSGDSKLEKTNKITKRAAFHTEINEDLEAIDAEVMRQLQIISTKGAISIAEIMKSFEERIRALITLIKINTPVAPTRTKPKVDVISAELVKMGQLSGPWLLLDVLEKRDAEQTNNASLARLIALHTTVQEHFYHVVWVKVGMTDKDRTEAILQRLASELARDAALSEAAALPVTTFDSPDEALRSITAAEEHVPRLVVLEDVRDRGLVDALRGTGLQLLVCASDRSVVAAKAGCTEVADLTEDEKSQVQVKTGEWMDQTEKDVWTVSFRTRDYAITDLAPAYSLTKMEAKSKEVVGKIAVAVDNDADSVRGPARTIEFTISNNSGQRLFLLGHHMESGKIVHFPEELEPGKSGPGYVRAHGRRNKGGGDDIKVLLLYQWGGIKEKIGFFLRASDDSAGGNKSSAQYFWDSNNSLLWYHDFLSKQATTPRGRCQANTLVVMSYIGKGKKSGASFVVER